MNFGVIRTTEATEYPLASRLSGVEYENASGRVVGAAKPATFSLFAERVRGLGDSSRTNYVQGGRFLYPEPPISFPCPYCVEAVDPIDGYDDECWACHVEDEPECVAKERAEYAACAS